MRRFVLLRHDYPFLHWDFLLEGEPTAPCRTWRFAAIPVLGETIAAERLPDHRAHYLDYEGPVSGNRGTVWREQAGTYEILNESPERLELELRNASGRWLLDLCRTTERPPEEQEPWTAHLREAAIRPSDVSP
jgi:hypothetical protein